MSYKLPNRGSTGSPTKPISLRLFQQFNYRFNTNGALIRVGWFIFIFILNRNERLDIKQ